MFDLAEGDSLTMIDFDDVRSEPPLDRQRSGRLRVFNVESKNEVADRRDDAKPGNLGYSLYTYRTDNLQDMRAKLNGSGAKQVTEIVADEFGQQAFSFLAPDGYFWTLIAA